MRLHRGEVFLLSDDSDLRLLKTFTTASNTWGEKKKTSFLPHGYDVVRDWFNRVTKALYVLRYSYWGLEVINLGLLTME